MEIIVNFGGGSDCDALNSRQKKGKTLSREASGHFLKCRLKDGRRRGGGAGKRPLTEPRHTNQTSGTFQWHEAFWSS